MSRKKNLRRQSQPRQEAQIHLGDGARKDRNIHLLKKTNNNNNKNSVRKYFCVRKYFTCIIPFNFHSPVGDAESRFYYPNYSD